MWPAWLRVAAGWMWHPEKKQEVACCLLSSREHGKEHRFPPTLPLPCDLTNLLNPAWSMIYTEALRYASTHFSSASCVQLQIALHSHTRTRTIANEATITQCSAKRACLVLQSHNKLSVHSKYSKLKFIFLNRKKWRKLMA